MRAECENQKANYLEYVDTLMRSERFDIQMFGSWANRVKRYKEFKEEQSRHSSGPFIDRSKLSTLKEDSYVEDLSDKTTSENKDRSSDISFKSANEMLALSKRAHPQNDVSTKYFILELCKWYL